MRSLPPGTTPAVAGASASPFTPAGLEAIKLLKPGNGVRIVDVSEINDPASTVGDPYGFPRILLYELRFLQFLQTPSQVVVLHQFEKRYRVIWTDGRQLPANPDPRWYGYSVGHWEDDYTFVVESNGTDERTWLDNAGNPHSADLRVEERWHRANQNTLELTVTINDPKYYTKPWVPRSKLVLGLMPSDTDFMEMIPSASESQAYQRVIASQARPKDPASTPGARK